MLHVVGGLGVLLDRPKLNQLMGMLCLVGAALIIGQYWAAADHLMEAYGSDARRIGEASRTKLWLAIPWGTFIPLVQTVAGMADSSFQQWLCHPVAGRNGHRRTGLWPGQAEQKSGGSRFLLWQGRDADYPRVRSATVLTPLKTVRPERQREATYTAGCCNGSSRPAR